VNLNASNGASPTAGLISDANGNLFGTTISGGAHGCGTVFEIAKTAAGYASAATVLDPNDCGSSAGLAIDSSRNLFGTRAQDGAAGCGTVFEIAKTARGYASTATVLATFDFFNGCGAYGGLIVDSSGNLLGMTEFGGRTGNGNVFEIVKTAGGYANTPTDVYDFSGTDGAYPLSSLIADTNGNLFGTTSQGGAFSSYCGTVFEIAKTAAGYASTATVLVNFDYYTSGCESVAALVVDSSGNFFGTTSQGGAGGNGNVFEIAKTAAGYASAPTILASFHYTDGAYPYGLIIDAKGNLFGTTIYGGEGGAGTVFEIAKTAAGYASTPTTLTSFDANNGNPFGRLMADAKGNLLGTTVQGGTSGNGKVFEIADSGFVPPVHFEGVPGTLGCVLVSTLKLALTYDGLPAAAKALGYSSVANLEKAVVAYCGNWSVPPGRGSEP
jgi:uncharacterized repeat protein (TIGR03803 family)